MKESLFIWVTLMVTVLALTNCSSSKNSSSDLKDSPTLMGTPVPEKIDPDSIILRLQRIGFIVDIHSSSNEVGRQELLLSMAEQWPRLKYKFKVIAEEFAKRNDIDLAEKIEIRFGDFYYVDSTIPHIILDAKMYLRLAKPESKPADLVARVLDLTYNYMISDGYDLFPNRSSIGSQSSVSSKIWFHAANTSGIFTASRSNFDLLLSSFRDINKFTYRNRGLIEAVSIDRGRNTYSKSDKELKLSVDSKEFPEIIKAIKANDIKRLGELVDEL